MKDVEDAGVLLRHKDDGKLIIRHTRNSEVTQVSECQFSDNAAWSRYGAEKALIKRWPGNLT